jgi:hypothetical protein
MISDFSKPWHFVNPKFNVAHVAPSEFGLQTPTGNSTEGCHSHVPIILLNGSDTAAAQNILANISSELVLATPAQSAVSADGWVAAPQAYPWIFILLCDKDILNSSEVVSAVRTILPSTFQINSRVLLVTCGDNYDAYYIRERLIVRQVDQVTTKMVSLAPKARIADSTLFRRKDFMREWIVAAQAVRFLNVAGFKS